MDFEVSKWTKIEGRKIRRMIAKEDPVAMKSLLSRDDRVSQFKDLKLKSTILRRLYITLPPLTELGY